MLHFPNAKINIGLYVTEKRSDGYHNLESIFYPLPMLKDALEVIPASQESSMRISGKTIDVDPHQNLVWKAFQLIQQKYPQQVTPIHIHLLKAIPMGAGLGGGSADAAFMLRLLNKFFELNLSDTELADLAFQLGSDCPFFIYNTPQLAKGRGEQLSPIVLDLSAYSIQVICPKLHVSTAAAFSKLSPKPATFHLEEISQLAISEWKEYISNDFEHTIFQSHPSLANIKENLYNSGAIYASMSGSGSALYGIFEEGKRMDIATDEHAEVFYFE